MHKLSDSNLTTLHESCSGKKYHSSNLVPDAVPIIYQFHEEHYAQTYNHDGLNLLYKDEKGKDEKGTEFEYKIRLENTLHFMLTIFTQ